MRSATDIGAMEWWLQKRLKLCRFGVGLHFPIGWRGPFRGSMTMSYDFLPDLEHMEWKYFCLWCKKELNAEGKALLSQHS